MGRWEPNASGRIARAAMDLYASRGFEETTVAEIAARAGVTERTFFRHFADKREVLFGGSHALEALLAQGVMAAPASAGPLEAVTHSLDGWAHRLNDRANSVRRQAIINANPSLRERELMKLARLASVMADTLRRRGIREPTASLAAETGMAAFRVAFQRWVDGSNKTDLPALIRDSVDQLRSVAGRASRSPSAAGRGGRAKAVAR